MGCVRACVCVGIVLWCVRTWSFQFSPSCVGSVLRRVRTLSFQSSHLCELCAVVCKDFDFQNSHMCRPCAVACEDSEFSKFPCAWVLCFGDDSFFEKESLLTVGKKICHIVLVSHVILLFHGV